MNGPAMIPRPRALSGLRAGLSLPALARGPSR
jgi:hypothetical protein